VLITWHNQHLWFCHFVNITNCPMAQVFNFLSK
jgi:hypothetical protein